MRVVFLSGAGQMGGAERALLDLLASLRAATGWELHLVLAAPGPLAQHAQRLGVEVHHLPFPASLARLGDAGWSGGRRATRLLGGVALAAPAGAAWLGRLRRLLARLGPDLVHSNGLKLHVAGALGVPRGVPLVWHVHDYLGPRPLMAGLLRRLAARPAAALAVSRSVAADLTRVCGERLPVQVMYNALDLERFSPVGEALELDQLGGLAPAAPGTLRVGLVATMGRWKGHAGFLRALALLPEDLSVRGYLVGGAVYATRGSEVDADALRRQAAEAGLAGRVGFTGFVDEPAAAMRALDVVVHASTQPEPFGLVIAEAMACGRAVVASAAGGAAEITRDGVDSLTFAPGDEAALATAISRLAADPGLRARLGAAGRARAVAEWDRARLAREAAPLFLRLAGQG